MCGRRGWGLRWVFRGLDFRRLLGWRIFMRSENVLEMDSMPRRRVVLVSLGRLEQPFERMQRERELGHSSHSFKP